jgi:hypothetical protein
MVGFAQASTHLRVLNSGPFQVQGTPEETKKKYNGQLCKTLPLNLYILIASDSSMPVAATSMITWSLPFTF